VFIQKLYTLFVKLQKIAKELGIVNLLQPGLIKEMIIADLLNHEIIIAKRDSDAHTPG